MTNASTNPRVDRYHHGDLDNACIEAALQLLSAHGLAHVTLREVARRIGVSRSAPYRHFANKRDLLAACAAAGFKALTAEAECVLAEQKRSDLAALRALMHGYADFGQSDPHLYRLMFASDFKSDEYPALTEAAEQAFAVLYRTVETGQQQAVLRAGPTYDVVLMLWSALHGLVSLCNDLAPGNVLDTSILPQHVDRVVDVLVPVLSPVVPHD